MEYNYTAIILRKRKIGETDRLYTFYTLESGKMQAIGRGIRKPKAKLAGHMETLSQSDIIVARRHGLGNIASAITEKYFINIRSNVFALQQVLGVISQFERLIDFEEKDEKLFSLLQEYLMTMNRMAPDQYVKMRLVTQGFLFQVLSHLGYHLDMQRCNISGEKLDSDGKYCFSPDIGGVMNAQYAREAKQIVFINANAIKLIRIFFRNPLYSLERVSVGEGDLRQVESVSKLFLEWISR